MKKPKELNGWDFPDNIKVSDGHNMEAIPYLTRKNFNHLVDEHNNLVECFNKLCELKQIKFWE